MRHDLQSLLDDYDNLSPRVSASWTPSGEGPTTITGGVGFFNEWYQTGVYEQGLLLDGVRQRDLIVRDPQFPNPFGGVGQIELPPPSIVREADDLEMTRTARVSVGVEHRLTPQVRLHVNGYGQRTLDRLRALNANAPVDGVNPDEAYHRITEVQSTGRSTYGGLDTSARLSSHDGSRPDSCATGTRSHGTTRTARCRCQPTVAIRRPNGVRRHGTCGTASLDS